MDIIQLSQNASNGDTGPYFEYLLSTRPKASEMEFDLEVHPNGFYNGNPVKAHMQCDGKLHSHPDNSWADCAPYVYRDGNYVAVKLLCDRCSNLVDPFGYDE